MATKLGRPRLSCPLAALPPRTRLPWDALAARLGQAVLTTLGERRAIVLAPTVTHLRLLGQLRGRLYRRGVRLRLSTDPGSNALYVWAEVGNRVSLGLARKAGRLAVASGPQLAVLQGGRARHA